MINKAKRIVGSLWKSEGQEEIQTPKGLAVKFVLRYKELTIGFLELKEGVWTYRYSDEFKQQYDIKPLTDFPDVNKLYESKELLPFFMQRIPSLSQPKVLAVIKKERIEKNNEVELLKRFGAYSITNPFELQPLS